MLRRRARDRNDHPKGLRTTQPRSSASFPVSAGLAGLALALAGCGGDEATTTAAPAEPEPLTKEAFIAEADRICFAVESQIEAAADDLAGAGEDPDAAQVRRVVMEIVVPRLRSEVNTIRLLDPPPEDEAEVDRILGATERGADALERDPVSVLDGLPADLREAERLARAYGSEQCGLASG